MERTVFPVVFRRVAWLSLGLAAVVVLLGAYVRLSNAGLGCPDWPGCYGHAIVPADSTLYPSRPLEPAKAWKEMIHRYAAGTLGLLILSLFLMAWRNRGLRRVRPLTSVLLALVSVQALLGMWTVTLKLKPVIVMGHLLGGFATAALLLWLVLSEKEKLLFPTAAAKWGVVALLVVLGQVALGGWTSANYAAPFCPDFPTCQASWWPNMDFAAALSPTLPPSAMDYEGGTLDAAARTAIHYTHRVGALITLITVGGLALWLLRLGASGRRWGALLGFAVMLQFGLGVANVLLQFPLPLAIAHNGGAAFLLLSTLAFNVRLRTAPAKLPAAEAELSESS